MAAPRWRVRLVYALLLAALAVSGLLWAGQALLAWGEGSPIHEPRAPWPRAVALAATLLAIGCAIYLWRREGRRLLFTLALAAMVLLASVLAGEAAARLMAPPWPAIGLHGVKPGDGARAWAHLTERPGAQRLNDWGQRDRPRTRRPADDVHRIIFLGDSFLEESSITPVSIYTEDLLANARIDGRRIEVVNLGVSGTDPDEYFFRARNIAAPMRPRHVFVFICMSNDFINPGSLESWEGIAAVYPRTSLLSRLGLLGINHALTNQDRPTIRVWRQGGDLRAAERATGLGMAAAPLSDIHGFLLANVAPSERPMVAMRLRSQDLSPLLEMIRRPDFDSFRSYYFRPALRQAASFQGMVVAVNPDAGISWLLATTHMLRAQGIRTTLVIIPEGTCVDPRMRACWMPLGDLAAYHEPYRRIAQDIVLNAPKVGEDVIDLHPVLDGKPGTYLNMDGHWSDLGNRLVAASLAEAIRQRHGLPTPATAPATMP